MTATEKRSSPPQQASSLSGNMWFDGFAGPWIAEVAPKALVAERTITLVVGRSPRSPVLRAGVDVVRDRPVGHASGR